MYKRGDYIIFSMKGRIADTIHDPIHGWCYIVECENPTQSVIRIPVDNVDVRFTPPAATKKPRRPMPPAYWEEDGKNAHSNIARRPSTNPVLIDGVPQEFLTVPRWRSDSFSDLNSPRRRPHPDSRELQRLGCPFPPGYFDEYPEG